MELNVKGLTGVILHQVKILDYLRDYYNVDFKLVGTSYQTNCMMPNHYDNTASFSIPLNGEYFKCFGACGAKGNVINFVEQYHNYSREEAIKKICDDVGIEIYDQKRDEGFVRHLKDKKTVCKEYISNLAKNDIVYDYLTNKRNINLDTIKEFKLGATINNHNEEYNNRITFPIYNHNNILAFAYGYTGDKNNFKAKYINDRNGEYFTKSDLFYGIPQAIETIRKQRRVYLVEGYFDVISMHQSGIKNVLGVMCASISQEQIDILKHYRCEVYLYLDNDEAGTRAIYNSIPILIKEGIKTKVINIPFTKDADELCNKYKFDKELVLTQIDKYTKDSLLFTINEEVENYNNTVLELKLSIIDKIMPIIQMLPSEIERELYKNHIYNTLKI